MKICTFNLKGGVGKSVLAINLARSFKLDYVTNDESIITQLYANANYVDKPTLADDTIFDLGGFLSPHISKIISGVDIVIVPCVNDYLTIAKTIQSIKQIEHKNILVIANRLEEQKDFDEIVANINGVCSAILPLNKSKIFKNSIEYSSSIEELANDNKLNKYLYKTVIKQYKTVIEHIKEMVT